MTKAKPTRPSLHSHLTPYKHVLQAALQETEQQLLQLQRDAAAQAGHLEAQTQEVLTLQELAAQQQATMVSNTKQSQESEQQLTQDASRLQVIFPLPSTDT